MTIEKTRREWALLAAAGSASGMLGSPLPGTAQPVPAGGRAPKIAMLVHPDMIMLDLAAPLTVFSLLQADTHLVWKGRQPVSTDIGIPVSPSITMAECPADLDVLFVPGGLKGTVALMDDAQVLGFLADRGSHAAYVTSVCTGSLLLGAAGLLKGYGATSHWYVRDLLAMMGATVRTDRVVTDRNRITGGGATAGLDFGLTLAAMLKDEATARRIQLVLEYDPSPPFDSGSPEPAGKTGVAEVLSRRAPLIASARERAVQARTRLSL